MYCHFSFKRPKELDNKGIFTVAFYTDYEGKNFIVRRTAELDLWSDHQFISAIQSYWFTLYTISDIQSSMLKNGITQVRLVTDNSTLAGWIVNHKKNKAYTQFMDKAVEQFKEGSPREIAVGVNLSKVRNYEKSYKFCKKELINYSLNENEVPKVDGINKIDLGEIEHESVLDILARQMQEPVMDGVQEV